MSVRRLADKQPETFAFSEDNLAWAKREIAKYPAGRQASAVISLLWRGQLQEGWVTEPMIREVAQILDMPRIRVLEIATFYTMFHLEPVGSKAHIQVCGTTPCWLRGANDLKDLCRTRIHPEQFHLSADGAFSWEEVECIGACVNAPLVQIDADTYEDLTSESFGKLLDDIAAGRPIKPGSQINRQNSAPVGGPTTLTDAAIFGPRPRPPVAPLTDNDAKKPTEAASAQESPAPKAPLANNPEDKKPNPVSKA
jgi:NADH-quinone oxidoreductase subunit E